jgi:hypothetical protein
MLPPGCKKTASSGSSASRKAGDREQGKEGVRGQGTEGQFRVESRQLTVCRVAHRYLNLGSKFAWNVALELLGVKKF